VAGRAMSQACVQTQAIPYGICDEKWHWDRFYVFPSTSVFPYQCRSTNDPLSFTYLDAI
jgi:hypothetical protein